MIDVIRLVKKVAIIRLSFRVNYINNKSKV